MLPIIIIEVIILFNFIFRTLLDDLGKEEEANKDYLKADFIK